MSDNRTLIVQLKDFTGRQVTLAGWVYQARSSGKVQFIILRDGSGLCQC
ncbi:MAG: asparagine--tRNA ligase, partial [Planctomycetes bacterium]|nr:asparagine--tRNA ligase [Planctomycetota bacterium]